MSNAWPTPAGGSTAGMTTSVRTNNAAFLAQIAVAYLLTRSMATADHWHLAAAQHNGITAIILALTLQIQFDNVVAIVAPAIITVNLIHAASNWFLDKRLPTPGRRSLPRSDQANDERTNTNLEHLSQTPTVRTTDNGPADQHQPSDQNERIT
jgi:hypothetical protein